MALVEYAENELKRAGFFDQDSDYAGLVGPAVLEMVKQFAAEGHSGCSASLCLYLFKRVAAWKPLTPVDNPIETGEYQEIATNTLQSTRFSSLFSDDGGKTWHDINLPVSWWNRKIMRRRWTNVNFPYSPK